MSLSRKISHHQIKCQYVRILTTECLALQRLDRSMPVSQQFGSQVVANGSALGSCTWIVPPIGACRARKTGVKVIMGSSKARANAMSTFTPPEAGTRSNRFGHARRISSLAVKRKQLVKKA